MTTYRIHQHSIRDISDAINALGSWTEAEQDPTIGPRVRIHLETTCNGAENFQPDWFKHYQHVADIDGDDLVDVFHAGNCGPEDRIARIGSMHSISVGDIIEDGDGNLHMVERYGFTELMNTRHLDAA